MPYWSLISRLGSMIYDFSPEQLANVTSIVWLYRGETDRFAALLESYRDRLRTHRRALVAALPTASQALSSLGSVIKLCPHALSPEFQTEMMGLAADCTSLEKLSAHRDFTKDSTSLPDFAAACRALVHRVRALGRVVDPLVTAALETTDDKKLKKDLKAERERTDAAWAPALAEAEATVYLTRHLEWLLHRFSSNLTDYMEEHTIPHAFHHNAFLIVSNGHRARYGSITSRWEHFYEWKRLGEDDRAGSVEAERLLNGMLAHDRLLDLVENFILFDASKAGQTRKIVARNHQVLGVNQAVASVRQQEALKLDFPPERRRTLRQIEIPERLALAAEEPTDDGSPYAAAAIEQREEKKSVRMLELVETAHPDLGRLGVFWHTQGSGKSYSMAFFAEKVRRTISGKFTFLFMTDREDLDSQIYGTFAGCEVIDPKTTPRASSGKELKRLLQENHRYIFSLIHKFNQDVDPREPYSTRDDIIVVSDEAHRTQAGKLARIF